jgi:hypothetical protein
VQEIEINIGGRGNNLAVLRSVDEAIKTCHLRITLKTSLRAFPGSTHWHVKNGRMPGTLEITWWPKQRGVWFSIQDGRKADWIDAAISALGKSIR